MTSKDLEQQHIKTMQGFTTKAELEAYVKGFEDAREYGNKLEEENGQLGKN